jgi:ketosteroid isomerase-like protein
VRSPHHPNATLVRELFAAFRNGNAARVEAAIPDDAVWHFPGRRGRLAGAHRGRQAIFVFLTKVMELTGGTFELDLIDVLANDRRAVALFRGTARREGKSLDNPTCLSMRIENGRIVELWEFVWDLYHVDDFWS